MINDKIIYKWMKYSEYLRNIKKLPTNLRNRCFYSKGYTFLDTGIAKGLLEYEDCRKEYKSMKNSFYSAFGDFETTSEHSKSYEDLSGP